VSELGQVLKAAREQKGLTLDDLQEITKIQKRYLLAIENGNFHHLPGPFYTRAFIRNIAETLNLDTEQLLSQYESTLPSASQEYIEPLPRRRQKLSQPTFLGRWVTPFLLLVFVVLILFIIYMFVVNKYPPSNVPEARADESAEVNDQMPKQGSGGINNNDHETKTEEEQPQSNSEPPKPLLTFVKEEGKTSYYQISNVDHLVLKMKATRGDVWYQIEKGRNGDVVDMKTLKKDEEGIWDLPDVSNIFIRLGATRNIDIWVNDQQIDLTEKPDVYRLDITLVPKSDG
jgi:cytoskeletal protein RodZ